MTLLYLLAEIGLLWYVYRRCGLLPTPTLYVAYLFLCQIVLWFAANDLVYYKFADYWSTGAYENHYGKVSLSYFILVCFYSALVVGMPRVDPRETFAKLRAVSIPSVAIYAMTLVLIVRELAHLAFLNWDIAWSSSVYLAMRDPALLNTDNAIVHMMVSLQRFTSLVAAVLAVYCICRNHTKVGIILLAITIWDILFMMAAHSRESAAVIATVGFSVYFLSKRKRPILVAAIMLFFLIAMSSALIGRASHHHGFSSLVEIPSLLFSVNSVADTTEFVILNFFEGVYTFAEHFASTVWYPTSYKLASISPFPGFIDHWPEISARFEDKLFIFAPRSALDEILQFGPFYVCVYFAVQAVAIRTALRVIAQRPGFAAIAINLVLFIALYTQTAYGVRLVFRFFILAIAFGLILLSPRWLPTKRNTSPPQYRRMT